MFWTILSVVVCLGIVVKLVFFSDEQRHHSSLFYRLVLFSSVVYAFSQILKTIYHPDIESNPWVAVLHLALFVAAFFFKSDHIEPIIPTSLSSSATKPKRRANRDKNENVT